jgi:hypothetical protein
MGERKQRKHHNLIDIHHDNECCSDQHTICAKTGLWTRTLPATIPTGTADRTARYSHVRTRSITRPRGASERDYSDAKRGYADYSGILTFTATRPIDVQILHRYMTSSTDGPIIADGFGELSIFQRQVEMMS